jgi:hypothetical protein
MYEIDVNTFNEIINQTRSKPAPKKRVAKKTAPVSVKHKKRLDKTGRSELGQIANKFTYRPQGKSANTYTLDENFIKLEKQPEGADLYACVRGYLPGETSEKLFYKVVCCGKETCPTCGKDYSIPHNRRVNRSFAKIVQMPRVGYMVITIPKELREKFNNPEMLTKFRTYVRRKLKHGTNVFVHARDIKTGKKVKVRTSKTNFSRGLMRWHWAGDDFTTWKPHLNILLDAGHLSPMLIENIRQDIAQWFYNEFGIVAPGNIYYAYTKNEGKIKHWLKYILRSTARKITDPQTCETINGYRNTTYFGKFEKGKQPQDSASAILSGCDPDTGEIITWGKLIKPGKFHMDIKRYAQKVTIKAKDNLPEIDIGVYIVDKSALP